MANIKYKEGDRIWVTLPALIASDDEKMSDEGICHEVYVNELDKTTFLIEGADEFEIKRRE